MFKNYCKTAMRSLLKTKTFSLINILGLAIGLTACLIIFQYVDFHSSFDDYHSKKERIYRLTCSFMQNNEDSGPTAFSSPALMAPTLAEEQSYVESFARIWTISYMNHSLMHFRNGSMTAYDEPTVFMVDPSLFEVFDLDVINGDIDRLKEPNTMILTESTALKYFSNNEDAIGKKMILSGNLGKQPYELVAIMKDLPANTHLDLNVMISFASYKEYNRHTQLDWNANGIATYFLFEEGIDVSGVRKNISDLYFKHKGNDKDRPSFIADFQLEPITSIHLGETDSGDFKSGIDEVIVYSMALIACIILFIAWINYLNLSLVKTLERTKEIGIRTALGSNKSQVSILFIVEAAIVNLMALAIAVTLSQLGAPLVEQLGGFAGTTSSNYGLMGLLLLSVLIGSLIAGLYPAIILKAFRTTDVLLGKKVNRVGGGSLRKFLVTIQFVISFILVAGTITVYKQVSYMKSADLGININNTMVIKAPPSDITNSDSAAVLAYNSFRTSLEQLSSVGKFANAGEVPGQPLSWGSNNLRLKNQAVSEAVGGNLLSMGIGFHDFFDIDLLAGRFYQQGDNPWGKGDAVINRKMSERLGFDTPEEAIGAKLDGFYNKNGLVVRGVVENHHHTSLHSDFDPIVYILSSWTEFYFVKFNIGTDLSDEERVKQFRSTIASIENEWNDGFPNNTLDYYFLDESFNAQYKEDERFGSVFTAFSVLAILIACLGLFGLFSFTLQQRVKEIGVRKVLGASSTNLITLLTRHYLIILCVAYVVSLPIYWHLAGLWLENYIFKIELGASLVIIPLLVVMSITVMTMLLRLAKSLKANPIDSLRYE